MVKIELGARSDDWPNSECHIQPYLAERFPQLIPEGPFPVRVLADERTFWEKACLLHEETFRPHDLLKWNCRHLAIAEIILQVSPAMPRERLFWPHVPRR